MKDHLSNTNALVMLLGAALGSGFLSIPYALDIFPVASKFLLHIITLECSDFTDPFQFWIRPHLLLLPCSSL